MKKVISTIVAIGFVSSMLVNSAYAGHGHMEVLNPLWVPVAILSTVAAIVQAPFVYEQHRYPEPRQTVIYEEPRQYRREHYHDRSYNERGRAYQEPRYREYR
jgi:hypothetical protein